MEPTALADTHPHHAISREEITELLRARGILPTRQRVEIAHALYAGCVHMSAEQLLQTVNLGQSESSKATVYNTLKLLVDKGLIREVIVDPGRVFYDPNTRPHHHFYNVVNGELIDIETDALQLSGLPTPPDGTVTDYVDVIIRIRPSQPPRPSAL